MGYRDNSNARALLPFLIVLGLVVFFLYNRGSQKGNHPRPSHGSPSGPSALEGKSLGDSDQNPMFTPQELLFFASGKELPGVDNVKRRLISYIRSHIARPSGVKPSLPVRHYSQFGESQAVDKLLSERRNGFFFECGALNGEYLSNSLFFELERNWTGLLVEANPASHEELLGKRRNAYILPACLSPKSVPSVMRFKLNLAFSGIAETLIHQSMKNDPETALNCFPIHAVLDAVGVKHIDYFSLDVEGAELPILKTMDFQRITVDIFTIEYAVSLEHLNGLRSFFNETFHKTGKLYEEVMLLPEGTAPEKGYDIVFRRKIA